MASLCQESKDHKASFLSALFCFILLLPFQVGVLISLALVMWGLILRSSSGLTAGRTKGTIKRVSVQLCTRLGLGRLFTTYFYSPGASHNLVPIVLHLLLQQRCGLLIVLNGQIQKSLEYVMCCVKSPEEA